jgi:hypothetical protein
MMFSSASAPLAYSPFGAPPKPKNEMAARVDAAAVRADV